MRWAWPNRCLEKYAHCSLLIPACNNATIRQHQDASMPQYATLAVGSRQRMLKVIATCNGHGQTGVLKKRTWPFDTTSSSAVCCPKQLREGQKDGGWAGWFAKHLIFPPTAANSLLHPLRWECRHADDSECAEKLTEKMKYLRKTDNYAQQQPRVLKIWHVCKPTCRE